VADPVYRSTRRVQDSARPLRVGLVDYVVDPYKPGRSGLSDIVWDMATHLVDLGHEAHVFGHYLTADYPDPRVTVHAVAIPKAWRRNVVGQSYILHRAARLMRAASLDVVHAPEYFSTALLSYWLPGLPLVMTTPGNIYHRLSVPNGSSYEWYFAQILKWAARRTAHRCHVIAISQAMARWWAKTGSRPESLTMIPLGVDRTRFHHVLGARRRLDLPADHPLFVYVGRFSREKGVMDLVEAVSRARSRSPALAVHLIGRGALEPELTRRIAAARLGGAVALHPWVAQEELKLWYSAADALVLPSYTEGLSRTILEAMACGLPVVGSRVSGTEDHVRDGLTGFLFEPGDVDGLADILAGIARAPGFTRALRPSVEAYAREVFDWTHIMRLVSERVYRPAAEGRRLSRAADYGAGSRTVSR